MRAKPPVKSTLEAQDKKNSFIDGANKKKEIRQTAAVKAKTSLPWDKDSVRSDVMKLFNIRLSEPDYLKLKYIAKNTPESMHAFCLNAIIPAIEKEIKKILPN